MTTETPEAAEASLEDRVIAAMGLEEPKEAEESADEIADEAVEEIEESEEAEEADEVETEEEPEFEIVHAGEKKRVKQSELVELAQKGVDYTKKTEEVAASRREVEAEKAALIQRAKDNEQYILDYAKVVSLDAEVKQYDGVDWDKLTDEDPVEAQKHYRRYQEKKQERNQLAAQVNYKRQQQLTEQQQVNAKLVQQGQAKLEAEIKDWGPQKREALQAYGKQLGMRDETIDAINDAAIVVALHKAQLYDQLQTKKPQNYKRLEALPKVVKPGAKSGPADHLVSEARKQFKQTGSVNDAARYYAKLLG